ncbi:MAG: metallophosphoesterase family protein [Lachnospiraceae bacterium]|nr:metallophosphoesterase family protein [Lachnospiraceae bacterium]
MREQKQNLHRIAILSDTHSLLRREIKEILQSCEVILHGGDIASRKTFEEIRAIAPAYFVRGNADEEWVAAADDMAEQLPIERDVELYGFHFYMTHKKKDIRQNLDGVDVVIYGHSHKYTQSIEHSRTIDRLHSAEKDILYLNPGSCGPRRFTQPITMAIMTVDEEKHTYFVERIDCKPDTGSDGKKPESGGQAEVSGELPVSGRDMDKLIRAIMKDMKANRTVDKIAVRNKVSVDFVNQILQLYTTHPGIDVDGILNRMDILGK